MKSNLISSYSLWNCKFSETSTLDHIFRNKFFDKDQLFQEEKKERKLSLAPWLQNSGFILKFRFYFNLQSPRVNFFKKLTSASVAHASSHFAQSSQY